MLGWRSAAMRPASLVRFSSTGLLSVSACTAAARSRVTSLREQLWLQATPPDMLLHHSPMERDFPRGMEREKLLAQLSSPPQRTCMTFSSGLVVLSPPVLSRIFTATSSSCHLQAAAGGAEWGWAGKLAWLCAGQQGRGWRQGHEPAGHRGVFSRGISGH